MPQGLAFTVNCNTEWCKQWSHLFTSFEILILLLSLSSSQYSQRCLINIGGCVSVSDTNIQQHIHLWRPYPSNSQISNKCRARADPLLLLLLLLLWRSWTTKPKQTSNNTLLLLLPKRLTANFFLSLKLCFLSFVYGHNKCFFSYLWSFIKTFTSSEEIWFWWRLKERPPTVQSTCTFNIHSCNLARVLHFSAFILFY